MKSMKRIICAALALLLLCSGVAARAAEGDAQEDRAEALHRLSLFQGTGAGYDLDGVLPREQAIAMVVRMLGAEKEAVEKNYQNPFTDVADWARPYVGYAYANWITGGTSLTVFGSGQLVTQTQYLTFLLRVLGYKDGVDFTWETPCALAEQIGLIESAQEHIEHFDRGDAVALSWAALSVRVKGSTDTLSDRLMKDGVFTEEEYAFALRVAELGLAAAQAEQKTQSEAARPEDGSAGGGDSGDSSNSGSGSTGGSGSEPSGGNADANETEDIPLA